MRKLIRAYQNRKFYRVDTSSYVNAPEVIRLIEEGYTVECKRTKNDITVSTRMRAEAAVLLQKAKEVRLG